MEKYVCADCGSEDIEVRAWIGANSGIVHEWCEDEMPECWCNHCEKTTRYRSIES